MSYDRSTKKCQECDMLFDYLHNAYSPGPPCEYCPYADDDYNIEDLEKEEEMYA